MTKTKVPFSDEQVRALNRHQTDGRFHPFTCGNSQCRTVFPNAVLIATPEGWRCEHCDYTQDWAHDFMLEPMS